MLGRTFEGIISHQLKHWICTLNEHTHITFFQLHFTQKEVLASMLSFIYLLLFPRLLENFIGFVFIRQTFIKHVQMYLFYFKRKFPISIKIQKLKFIVMDNACYTLYCFNYLCPLKSWNQSRLVKLSIEDIF